jgi:hypothetical protein
MPPKRKISDISSLSGNVKAVKREKDNTQFIKREHTYIYQST